MKGRPARCCGTTPSGSASNCARRCGRSGASSRRRSSDPGAALVLRSLRAGPRRALPQRRRRRAEIPGRTCRPTSSPQTPRYWALAPGARMARLRPCRAGLRDHRSEQADPADARASTAPPAPMRHTAFRRRWSRNICAKTASSPEKNDLNSLLFLLTPGVESSKAGTLLSALVAFKQLHDDNAPLEDVIPEFVGAPPQRYARYAPARPLRRDARLLPRAAGTSALASGAIRARASARAGHGAAGGGAADGAQQGAITCRSTSWRADRDDALRGLSAGHRHHRAGRAARRARQARCSTISRLFERSANLFPGFEAEIQGIYREIEPRMAQSDSTPMSRAIREEF